MNRKSSRRNKLLLDTPFLLPTLGFETSKRIINALPKLRKYELYYSDLSILEALWKIIKKIRGTEEEIKRIKEGIAAIRETMNTVTISEEAVQKAIEMYLLGHRDMVDNLLYSIALTQELKLLTIDTKLLRFVKNKKFPAHPIALPEELE